MKTALITGITGQDGSYLAELLLNKGYIVYGLVRRVGIEDINNRYSRINHILNKLQLVDGSVENYNQMFRVINEIKPDELYHLAAQSFVGTSFRDEFTTFKINQDGTHNILSILKDVSPHTKFYFAGSSEQFGKVKESPQTENTPFHPRSPYGISKVFGFDLTRHYREAYNIFACSGILFNHESPRRGTEFVTRKITTTVATISKQILDGLEPDKLKLGNITAKRDWGHAKDYVRAMWMMLQHHTPTDYVVCTGKTHSVASFCNVAFNGVGLNYKDHLIVDENLFRPTDVEILVGDCSKIKNVLGWEPEISFSELVHEMITYDSIFTKVSNRG